MATFTIRSRHHGDTTFFVPDGDREGYVRLERGRRHGTLGDQICYGGGFRGNTVTATASTLEQEARKWWRQYLAHERKECGFGAIPRRMESDAG